jgi:hypothetical protein
MTQEGGSTRRQDAKAWSLKCSECGDRIGVELPAAFEMGATGTERCHRGHLLLYRYDGVRVSLVDILTVAR